MARGAARRVQTLEPGNKDAEPVMKGVRELRRREDVVAKKMCSKMFG